MGIEWRVGGMLRELFRWFGIFGREERREGLRRGEVWSVFGW